MLALVFDMINCGMGEGLPELTSGTELLYFFIELRPHINIKYCANFKVWDFHYKDKMVIRPYYFNNSNPYTMYTGKASLY